MKRKFYVLLIVLFTGVPVIAQDFIWKAGLFSFFDNREFAGSQYTIPQTMAGLALTPQAGFRWDSVHSVMAGVSTIYEFGSTLQDGRLFPVVYYRYSRENMRFMMGSFPRSGITERFPRYFFQDSIYYYRPVMTGFYFGVGDEDDYLDLWVDWTGRKSVLVRETFFAGLAARLKRDMFYIKGTGLMFHFAGKDAPVEDDALHDNMLFQAVAGIDLSERTRFDRLEAEAGWVTGLERARAENTGWISLNGFVAAAAIESGFVGLRASFYTGTGLMHFYGDHGNQLYWGDPSYRARNYGRTDLYIRFLRERTVDLELTWSVHFMESRVYNEQMLKLKVDIGKP